MSYIRKTLLAMIALLLIWGCEEESSGSAGKQTVLDLRADDTGSGYNFTIDKLVKSDVAVYADDTPLVKKLWDSLQVRWGFRRKSAKDNAKVYWVQKSQSDPDTENDYSIVVADQDKAVFVPKELPEALRDEAEVEVYAMIQGQGAFQLFSESDLPEDFQILLSQALTVSGLIANQSAIAAGRSQDRNVAEAGVYFIHKSTGKIFQVFSEANGRYSIRLSSTGDFVLAVLHQRQSFQPYVRELPINASITKNILLSELAPSAAMAPNRLYDISDNSLASISGSGPSISGTTINLDDNTPIPKALLLFYDLAAAKTYVLQSAAQSTSPNAVVGTFNTHLPTSKKLSFTPSAYGYVPEQTTQTLNQNPPIDLQVVGLRPIPTSTPTPSNTLDAPEIRLASPPTDDSISLSWDAVDNASSYKVSWDTDRQATTYGDTAAQSSTSHDISGLSANTIYYVKVQAIAASASNYRDSPASMILTVQTARTGPTPLAAPTSLQVTAVSSSSLSATWDPVSHASGYEIAWGTDAQATNGSTAAASGTSHNSSGLSANTRYYFKVKATGVGNYSDSSYSSIADATTAKTTLPAPTLTIGTVRDNSIAVSWSAVANASGYEVSWGTDSQAANGGNPIAVSKTKRTIGNLSANTRYYFKAKATGAGSYNDSPYSALVSATTDKTALPAPTLTAGAVTPNSIAVSWNAVPNAASYEVWWGQNASSSTAAVSSGTNYTIPGLSAYTGYDVKVKAKARGNYNDSPYSNTVRSTTSQVPLAAPTMTLDSVTGNSARLSWNAINHAGGYIISWGTDSQASNQPAVQESSTNYLFTNLSANTRYYFKAQALGTGSYRSSAYSTIVTAATGKTPLLAPTLTVGSVTNNSIVLSWTAVAHASGYTVSWGASSNASGSTATLAVNASSHTISGLSANTLYYVKLKATASSAGNYLDSSYSTPTSATTGKTLLATPSPTVGTVTPSSIAISWAAVAHVSGYTVSWGTSSSASGSTASTTSHTTSHTISGLSADTRYYIKVKATGSGSYQNGNYSTAIAGVTAKIVLAAPTLLAASAISSSAMTVTWGAVANAAGYRISWGTDSNASNGNATTLGASATSYTVSGLSANTRYYIKLKATASSSRSNYAGSAYSSPISGTTSKIVLATPSPVGMVSSLTTSNSMTFTWSAVLHTSNYQVSWGTDPQATNGGIGQTNFGYVLRNLTPNTRYYAKVKALGTGIYADSPYNSPKSGTTKAVLAIPSPTLGSLTPSSIPLSWGAVANAAGYRISWGTDSNASNGNATTLGASATSYTVSGLSANTRYYIKLKATASSSNYAGSPYSSPLSATTPKIILTTPPPVGMVTTTITFNSMTFTWGAVPHASGYMISWGTDNNATNGGTGSSNFGYVLRNLAPNTRYYAKVKALGTGDYADSPYNSPRSGTTKKTPLNIPNLSLGSPTEDRIPLSWGAVANAAGYQISWGTGSNASGSAATLGASTTNYTISGLSANTRYYIKLKATSSSRSNYADSPYSSPQPVKTAKISLSRPTISAVVPTSNRSFSARFRSLSARFTPIPNAVAYRISWGTTSSASDADTTVQAGTNKKRSLVISNLLPNTLYYVKLQSVAAADDPKYRDSPYSLAVSGTTRP